MICDIIKELRERNGTTQSGLAKKLGVTRSSVNAWEMGLSVPTAQYIVALAQYFHVSTDYLLGLDDKEAVYLDTLTKREKRILYDLIDCFSEKETEGE